MALWSLPGFNEGRVEVSATRPGRRRRGLIVHRVLELPPADVTVVDGIPVTTVARTLIDIAAFVPPTVLEEALDDALRRKLVSLVRMRWRLGDLARPGRPGIAPMRALLASREAAVAVPQSVFETRLLKLLKDAGLPMPTLQHEIRSGSRLVAVVDFAFPALRVAIEAEGYRWHSGRVRWERDLQRRNALTALGWHIVHVTWTGLRDRPRETVEGIKAALIHATTAQR